jgi:hypothetical protein
MMYDRVISVAGHEEHPQIRIATDKLGSAHETEKIVR